MKETFPLLYIIYIASYLSYLSECPLLYITQSFVFVSFFGREVVCFFFFFFFEKESKQTTTTHTGKLLNTIYDFHFE